MFRRAVIDEDDIFRRADGKYLHIREIYDDGSFGADICENANLCCPAIIGWAEVEREDLAAMVPIPNLHRVWPGGQPH
jgi:hypothetical protein